MTEQIPQTTADVPEDLAWQRSLLPVMVSLVLGLTLFFFAATMYQLFELNKKVQAAPTLELSELEGDTQSDAPFMVKQWRSLVMLEAHILQQRYHQAHVLLMARIWMRYLGFVTGMILALIGAVFILGKLREQTTTLDIDVGGESQSALAAMVQQNVKVQLATQSPGIVLTTLGTVLMLVTILVHHPIEVTDSPIYTSVDAGGAAVAASKEAPPELNFEQGENETDEDVGDINARLNQLRQSRSNCPEESCE